MNVLLKYGLLAVALAVIAVIMAGCVTANVSADDNNSLNKNGAHSVSVWSDTELFNKYSFNPSIEKVEIPEDDVVCYILWYGDGSGISCMHRVNV